MHIKPIHNIHKMHFKLILVFIQVNFNIRLKKGIKKYIYIYTYFFCFNK